MLAYAVRGARVAGAFIWMGYREMLAYPLGLAIGQFSAVISTIGLYFIAKLIPSTSSVGGDYYTFAMIGIICIQVMAVGLSSFTTHLDYIIQQGRFESLLVEPVNWRLLPFGLAAWPMLLNSITAALMAGTALVLGADIRVSGIPLSLVVLLLGIAAGHAVGILAASVKVIAKRGDPIIGLYSLATGLLTGSAFPVQLLPLPLRVLSYCLPPTYVISAVRRLLMPNGDQLSGPTALQAVLLLIGFLVVMYPLALWLYGRSLEFGRKMGLLAGY